MLNANKRNLQKKCKSFAWKKSLQFHIRAVHQKQKPLVCIECGKSFGKSSHLKQQDTQDTTALFSAPVRSCRVFLLNTRKQTSGWRLYFSNTPLKKMATCGHTHTVTTVATSQDTPTSAPKQNTKFFQI